MTDEPGDLLSSPLQMNVFYCWVDTASVDQIEFCSDKLGVNKRVETLSLHFVWEGVELFIMERYIFVCQNLISWLNCAYVSNDACKDDNLIPLFKIFSCLPYCSQDKKNHTL